MLILQIVIALIIARVIDTRIVRPLLANDPIFLFGHLILNRRKHKNHKD